MVWVPEIKEFTLKEWYSIYKNDPTISAYFMDYGETKMPPRPYFFNVFKKI